PRDGPSPRCHGSNGEDDDCQPTERSTHVSLQLGFGVPHVMENSTDCQGSDFNHFTIVKVQSGPSSSYGLTLRATNHR
ncbi:hypothetical protein HAX54_013612, partial [Datura stramonium]|nr:hypothetical protein [Datura stramonium]